MEFRDYYATLGVPKTASAADIKRAFRKLARQYHPDVNPGDKAAESKFKEINEANEVLSDPDTRKKYDELGANWRQYEQAQQQGGPFPGGGPFRGQAQPGWSGGAGTGGGGFRTMTPDEMREMFGADDPFSDFFHTFFGGAGGAGGGGFSGGARRTRGPVRGQDLESTVDLTLEEAFTGTTRRLMREGASKPTDVRIPAGVKDGARVRAAGEGEQAAGGGKPGDLYLNVRLLPHRTFERRDQDLYVHVSVPVALAVLGGEVPVPTLTGGTLRLKLPELTQAGQVFRLRGHGMPAVGKADTRGDLYATVDVKLPSQLSGDERAHYEALRDLATTRVS